MKVVLIEKPKFISAILEKFTELKKGENKSVKANTTFFKCCQFGRQVNSCRRSAVIVYNKVEPIYVQ